MFVPRSADSVEIGAHYYRKETEQWAANERLARLGRARHPGLFARALSSLGLLVVGRQTAEEAAPTLPRPLAPVTMLRPTGVPAESEDDLLEGHRGSAAA